MSNVLIGILGTLSGAIVGFITSEIQERNRWRRSLDVRWDETRRSLYATYLSTANANLSRVTWAARHQEQARGSTTFKLDEDFHLIGDADNATLGESIQLVAGQDLVGAAQDLLRALWDAKNYVIKGGFRTDKEMQELVNRFVDARGRYIAAARAELGIDPLEV